MVSAACSKSDDYLNSATPEDVVTQSTLADTSKTDTSGTPVVPVPVIPGAVTLRNNVPFPVGAAVNINLLQNDTAYRALVSREFSSITAESKMKISALHPSENVYKWENADYLVDFALSQHMRVHGHTLIWGSSLPTWIKEFKGDSVAWENLFRDYIHTVVSHFKGRVASWDVVNEPFKDDGTLKSTLWSQKLGSDYIARAFIYAHEADPNAVLFLNDYGHEYGNNKRRGIISYVKGLVARGIPIHGIGMQMHARYNLDDNSFVKAITEVGATGLKVHISELDIALNPSSNKSLVLTPELLDLQAAKYKLVFKTYNSLPKSQQFGITTWNVTDGDSWIPDNYNRPDWPLLFDAHYNKKPAYAAVLEAVK